MSETRSPVIEQECAVAQKELDNLWNIIERDPAIADSVRREVAASQNIVSSAEPDFRDRLRRLNDRLTLEYLRFSARQVDLGRRADEEQSNDS